MPPSRRKQIFEELGLLAEQGELPNPYQVLGIDPQFAREVLREDNSGAGLRFVAAGMLRTLARRYHPDVKKTGKEERFKEMEGAGERIEKASAAVLLRWAKVEGAANTAQQAKQHEQRALVASRAAELVRMNMELGRHPQHFSQFEWSQGVLLRRDSSTLLARQNQKGGLRVSTGEAFILDKTRGPTAMHTQAFDFQTFLKDSGSFGLPPDTRIAAYLDETGRASILKPDLQFVMDITDAVATYRERRRQSPQDERDASDAWSRSTDPVLLITDVPGPTHAKKPEAQVVSFPSRLGKSRSSQSGVWNISMEVAGSLGDEDFFRKVRYNKAAGAAALRGNANQPTMSYFSMVGVPTQQFIEQDAGYSPLMTPGNSLLLYDAHGQVPVVTNANVLGMIGNGAQN